VAIALVLAALWAVPLQTVDRAWQSGVWGTPGKPSRAGIRAYAVETSLARLDVEEAVAKDVPPLDTPVGGAVAFAIDGDTLYVRQKSGAERALAIVRRTKKLPTYDATGPGHSIRAVGEAGETITLEDGSVWSVDPRTAFKVAEWQPLAQISVHSTAEDPDFNYILNNGDVDDWTFATLVPPK